MRCLILHHAPKGELEDELFQQYTQDQFLAASEELGTFLELLEEENEFGLSALAQELLSESAANTQEQLDDVPEELVRELI